MSNPLFGHRGRDEGFILRLVRAWDAPSHRPYLGGQQPYAPGKLPPSKLDVDAPPAYKWELITLPPLWPYPQRRKLIAAIIPTGTTASADWNAVAAGTAAWIGAATDNADWSAIAAGTAAWEGTFVANTAPKAAFQQHILRAWDAPSVMPQTARFVPQAAVAAAGGDWSSAGAGAAAFTGQALDSADWNALGSGTASWAGAAVQPGAADWRATGAATADWTQASTAEGAFASSGASTARFAGAGAPASTVTRDGWRIRAQQAERRRRKDEQEIMAIAAAVLPHIQHGQRGTMRIDL